MTSAKKALSDKLFKESIQDSFIIDIGIGTGEYKVKVPHTYRPDTIWHCIAPSATAYKLMRLVEDALSRFEKTPFMQTQIQQRGPKILGLLEAYEDIKKRGLHGYGTYSFKVDGEWYTRIPCYGGGKSGLRTAAVLLAHAANAIQTGTGLTPEEEQFWVKIVSEHVENKIGLSDIFRITTRSRAAGAKLGKEIVPHHPTQTATLDAA